ncbi:MAG: hypothetical protein J07HN6_01666 [Halonotius sp. J07HN6]|nr:MAG: hypothetical protein J07HN6_01666 [Halonotius sp. J07HN6]ERH05539.1 MAG: hypothetical protein J07HN4v3_01140 [Halonotius sp. J07HN4]
MAENVSKTGFKDRAEQTEIVILGDQTEMEIGAASAISPPIPQVGDLVSLTNFSTESRGPGDEDSTRDDDSISFRVTDRAVHYEMIEPEEDSGETQLLTEVMLYVVSKDEWAARRQRGT